MTDRRGIFGGNPSKTIGDVAPSNGRAPVASSSSTTPSDQGSVLASTSSPRACSGDMYAAVPSVTPVSVESEAA